MSRAATALVLAGAVSVLVLAWLALQDELEGTGLALADHGIESPALPDLASIEGAVAPIVATVEDFVGLGPSAALLAGYTAESNVAAFLAMVRVCETGTAGANAYRTLYGGDYFDGFGDHPRIAKASPWGWSTAAGAYQILARSPVPSSARSTELDTWGEAKRALGLPDFSPASQDAAALWLIRRRGALADVRAGRFDVAIAKCAREWASLPGSPYGQPTKTLDRVRDLYANAGGSYA